MNATPREVNVLIDELDEKKEGLIAYEEFVNCCFLSYLFQKEYKIRLLCEEIDTAKQGTITLLQLRKIIECEEVQLSSEQLDRIFKVELGVDIA